MAASAIANGAGWQQGYVKRIATGMDWTALRRCLLPGLLAAWMLPAGCAPREPLGPRPNEEEVQRLRGDRTVPPAEPDSDGANTADR